LQIACWGGFFTAEYGLFNAAEYEMYIGIALMMLIGFGYLMTFLKAYGLGAVGFTFIITCLSVQMNMFLACLIPNNTKLTVDAVSLTDGNFAAATVLISYGCILGKSTPLQLVVLTILESIFFQINRNIFSFKHFQVEDAGGTIVIHVFGAYFGLAVAKVLGPPKDQANLNNTSGISDILSLVGTIFLWLFWPSFNGGAFTADPVQAGRAVANTVVALLGSTTCTFLISGIIGGKLTPADIQNATLAGGVAVGAVARMDMGLGWASICGSFGGTLSTLGYQYIQPFLERKIGLYDTCGVNNLHGMPGLFGSLISVIFAVTAWESWMPWPKDQIAYYQLASLGSTLAMALVCGAFTGYVCKYCKEIIKRVNALPEHPTQADLDSSVHFNDGSYWKASDDSFSDKTPVSTTGKVLPTGAAV